MTDTPLFDLVFTGKLLDGADIDDVKRKAAKAFKLDARKVDQLFVQAPTRLKKRVSHTAAKQYQQVLTAMGMDVDIRACEVLAPVGSDASGASGTVEAKVLSAADSESEGISPVVDVPVGNKPEDSNPAAEAASSTESGASLNLPSPQKIPEWSLHDVGSQLSEHQEKEAATVADLDVEVMPLVDSLLKPEERSPDVEPPALPAIESIQVRSLGERLSDARKVDAVIVETDHLSVQQSRGFLLKDSEKTQYEVLDIDVGNIHLGT